ncbi:MAG: hypothetical protein ABSH17_06350 [Syntrophobacteraceae bacterium]|jgi:hypothetical protein
MQYFKKVFRSIHADELEKMEQRWLDENPGIVIDVWKAWNVGGNLQNFLINITYHSEPGAAPPVRDEGQ